MKDLCHVQLAVSGGHFYPDLPTDCAFLWRQAAYDAFKLKIKQSFEKIIIKSCGIILVKKWPYSSTTMTIFKTAPSTGTIKKNQDKFNMPKYYFYYFC